MLGDTFGMEEFITGRIIDGVFGATGSPKRIGPFVIEKGKKVDTPWQEALKAFGADDVFFKGANAVDADGYAGILIGNPVSGTIGAALPVVAARGSHLIMPVGLEKLIPSVIDASQAYTGVKRVKYTLDDYPVGYMPVVNATVITEVQAIEELFMVEATHIASGGIAGSEGSIVMLVEGLDEDVKACMDFVKTIKGEPAVVRPS
jgi:hypothetical protein